MSQKKSNQKKRRAKKLAAAAAEAAGEFATFTHRGLDFTIRHPRKFPLEVLMTDDELVATQLILGDDQWAAYMATRPSIEDFGELTRSMSEAQGRDANSGN
ncbi:hypothetical protein [Streptomyces sp. NPDC005955]|uniref:hypothetical protein n=1 Tax=Streptomyces sp. NPDC005955 TaxID=3364738 RepID=UPI0036912FE3